MRKHVIQNSQDLSINVIIFCVKVYWNSDHIMCLKNDTISTFKWISWYQSFRGVWLSMMWKSKCTWYKVLYIYACVCIPVFLQSKWIIVKGSHNLLEEGERKWTLRIFKSTPSVLSHTLKSQGPGPMCQPYRMCERWLSVYWHGVTKTTKIQRKICSIWRNTG